MVGLVHADNGFFDETIVSFLEGRKIDSIISARLTHSLQAAIVREARLRALETGLELAEIANQAQSWAVPRRIVVMRQSIKRKTAPGKTPSPFADDPDLSGWRHGAMVTLLTLPDVKVWRSYRERADGENRIAELKADSGLDSFTLSDFWATESALGFAMLACAPKEVLLGPPDEPVPASCQQTKVPPALATLHGQVLAIGASWHRNRDYNTLILSYPGRRRAWFTGLWSNAGYPPLIRFAAWIRSMDNLRLRFVRDQSMPTVRWNSFGRSQRTSTC